MNDLSRRIARLEALRLVTSGADARAQARHKRRMEGLKAFVEAAWPESGECIAHHVAQILGLPDAPAIRAHIKGQSVEAIARDRYGENWQAEMGAKAEAAAKQCEAVQGPEWWKKFAAIWRGE